MRNFYRLHATFIFILWLMDETRRESWRAPHLARITITRMFSLVDVAAQFLFVVRPLPSKSTFLFQRAEHHFDSFLFSFRNIDKSLTKVLTKI